MAPVLACLVTAIPLPDTSSTPGWLPAVLLTGDGEPGGLGSHLQRLVGRGWVYAEPPVRLSPIPSLHQDADTQTVPVRRPVLLAPCPPADEQTLALMGRQPQSRSEWSQRVRELGQRCAVFLAPTVDPHASDLPDQLDHEAGRGQIIWTTARITGTKPAPPERHCPVPP